MFYFLWFIGVVFAVFVTISLVKWLDNKNFFDEK